MPNEPKNRMSEKTKKIISIAGILIFVAISALICVFIGIPLLKFVSEPEKFRLWVDSHGAAGRVAFVGMVILQVFIAVIPGEPLEIGAGYAFGALEGTLLCLLGIAIGGSLVFLFVRYFGIRAVEVFFSREKINSMKYLRDSKRLNLLMFILFLIPGTPKDLLSYFAGLTKIKFSTFLLISITARIPSVVTSTLGGNALGIQNYDFAIIAFAVALLISLIGIIIYNRIRKRRQNRIAAESSVDNVIGLMEKRE